MAIGRMPSVTTACATPERLPKNFSNQRSRFIPFHSTSFADCARTTS